jgi:hypothetical protein
MCRAECPWKKFLIHEIQCNAGWDLMCAWDVVNSSKPYLGHMHTAPYVPRPIAFILCKTTGQHVCFWSMLPFHTYINFLDSVDVEAYTDAEPPSTAHCAPLTTYSDAC